MPEKVLMPTTSDTRMDSPIVSPPGPTRPAELAAAPPARWYDACKLALDCLLAATLLVVAAPVILLVALAIKLTSRGPVFYSQTRLGRNGRPYTLYKIRTMVVDSEKNGACWSVPGDPRVTRLGRFLRRTHLDELPQLWNILKGDMSLVGPRPERPEFVPALEQAIPRYRERLAVRPGLTGLAQVQLPPDTDLDSVRRKLLYDLWYVDQRGPWLDLRLLLATGFKMLGMSFGLLALLFRLPRLTAAASPPEPALAESPARDFTPPPDSIRTATGLDVLSAPVLLNAPQQA
jgi:lipopolysaccharide/colanic/teichoic acid biosynthesis glycosyltransferase